jgi:ATP-dependent DNA helicase RecG
MEVEDRHLLDQIGCDTIIDLALHVPSAYEDTTLYTQPMWGKKQAILVKVLSFAINNGNMKVDLFCENLGFPLSSMIFHPKPYHYAVFKKDAEMVLYGTLENTQWGIQMSQPKKIGKSGEMLTQFSTKLRVDIHRRLVKTYINVENLMKDGLDQKRSEIIVGAFSRHKDDIEKYNNEGVSFEEREALKFAECYSYMKKLAKKRFVFDSITDDIVDAKPWIESLPFTLTDDQLKAISEISDDLQNSVSAKRMIIGDVGAGKTMLILATAYMNQKHKSVLMAPTALLATQLFEEAQKFLPHLKSILVTNKHGKKANLQEYDFIIGTHALLYRDLPTASVVMIDEQHRFGTKQRNKIDKLVQEGEKRPHVFQLSATPIPRTLAMVNSALLEVSTLEQMPFKKDITTKVIDKSHFSDLLTHIKNEISEERQVLIIYPLVEESETIEYQSIEEARSFWEKKFDDVYVTHGKDKNKDQVLLDFREKGKILVATTVVEVGISLPKLSTIVIVAAERLGFAALHQLRGRVSRTGLKGYCFLYSHQKASKRLLEFSKVTNGFDIADLDLRYRESGDLLSGKRQSGSKFFWFNEAEDLAIAEDVKNYLLEEAKMASK